MTVTDEQTEANEVADRVWSACVGDLDAFEWVMQREPELQRLYPELMASIDKPRPRRGRRP